MKTTAPLISVCIPVYSTEMYLAQCLRSVIAQDFPDFEIVIVSDASRGKDTEGRSAKKIVKLMQKESDRMRKKKNLPRIPLRFFEHKENRGLLEVRRTLCYEARGIFLTQADSDDEMESGALTALYNAARFDLQAAAPADSGTDNLDADNSAERFFDIVHGTSTAGTFDSEGNFTPSKQNRYGRIFYGTIQEHDVFRRWLLDGAFTANTWGKLIKRELWHKAYENIPYTECNMADDVLLFFFLAQYARSYKGIEAKVYRYRVNTGMTSSRKIDTIQKWKMVCSAASVFSVIITWIDESPSLLNSDETDKVRAMTRSYLSNNLKQMKEAVIPELQEEAYRMLCDYWGDHFVKTIEEAVQRKSGIVPRTENSPCSAPNSAAKE